MQAVKKRPREAVRYRETRTGASTLATEAFVELLISELQGATDGDMLPQNIVDSQTVSRFQRKLQNCTKKLAQSNFPSWMSFLDEGVRNTSCSHFQSCFL